MDPLSATEFARIVNGELLGGDDGLLIENVAIHSARIRSGAVFFALEGANFDGHDFVDAAFRNGALLAVVEVGRVSERMLGETPVVAVDKPLWALQRLAAWWRRSLDTRFVAIVGSNGKTVTKDCLVHLLSSIHSVYGTPGSYNSQLGVPLAVLGCPRSAAIAVIEIAVSDPGEMAHITQIVKPQHVVLTNVGTRWRYRFVDRERQIEELLYIGSALPPDGWLLLGQDDQEIRAAAADLISVVFTQGESAEVPRFYRGRREGATGEVEVAFPSQPNSSTVSIRTPSDEIMSDVELAVSAAWLLGVDAPSIVSALDEYTPTSTRMEIWRSPSGVILIRDIATPDPMAVSSALRAAKRLTGQGGRTVVVLAEPSPQWDREASLELARTLVAERVDELLSLVPSNHGVDSSVISELHDSIAVQLFDTTDGLRRHLVENFSSGDVCLVQSPPGSRIDDLSVSLVEAMAPTRLYLDLSAMEENVAMFRRLVGPGVRIMAMVKALAYGTDVTAASLGVQESGIDFLGVSSADEGVALRRSGVSLPILVMLGTESEIEKMVRYRLTPLLYSASMVDAITTFAKETLKPLVVHLEVDTGMHRAGLDWNEVSSTASEKSAIGALTELSLLDNVRIEGLMTHFASADDPGQDDMTLLQLERFEHVVDAAHALGLEPILHAAATAGALRFPSARYDMIRIGLGLFGLQPSGATEREIKLMPVISLVSRVVQIVEVPAGEGVGYGATYVAPAQGGRVGVVPAGYHDCIPRSFSNFGYVIVAGVRCPIVGRVSMDSMTIDLSACPAATVGSDVLIYGGFGSSEVPLEEVSRAIGTIPYEVMARVGPRVQRVFTRH
jgi:alanine racemase